MKSMVFKPPSSSASRRTAGALGFFDLHPTSRHSAAVERSAWFVAVLLLRHLGIVADKFSENRDRLFARIVDPINTHAVIGVGVFRDLEQIGWSGVVKSHGQGIRREDVVSDVTAPLTGDVFYTSSHRRYL